MNKYRVYFKDKSGHMSSIEIQAGGTTAAKVAARSQRRGKGLSTEVHNIVEVFDHG